MRDVGKKGV